ncbi:MAG: hypothetical protein QOK19_723 [Solirubrobacteraceae bacterium]|jgi:hypothetical protein|nr:hypothetical protein [Solirubrobacterales bacterium]MEA2215162.1 hypothetical protein [Solirubrobacteraceae bacterium]
MLASLALAAPATSAAGGGQASAATPAKPVQSATLEQCLTSSVQAERAATFSGEMTAIPGSAKMEMRIEVLERAPREMAFHTVTAAGLGVWRVAAPGVKTYKYLKQVTNLAAPAYYRGAIRFRWLNARGKLIRSAELRTARCLQTIQAEGPVAGEAPAKPA